eukprot:CAMPEP_0183307798 /NCGR_PEP_ID=MMETSP0160_2-20130417/19473_1 /TAXON_ID=2839 ORGANISM="Odontella Sinensis, Strain Grunow 1884" /NCGR_SAMPLE_ID=MMETSP0160_2 /ASSEMBLY_ACC=CAM_ASM_000250 /LENGTH=142 /DNA_ID=CAMNT_0025471473 /DNA_START=83 /DNA_END=507 /DNA_ORIENTATION=-
MAATADAPPLQFTPYAYTPTVKFLGINVGGTILQRPAEYLNALTSYLHQNAWSIVFLILGGYLVKVKVLDPMHEKYRKARSYREATDPNRVASLQTDMRRVRLAQQEEAAKRSREAEEEARKKKAEEKDKKRIKHPIEERGG